MLQRSNASTAHSRCLSVVLVGCLALLTASATAGDPTESISAYLASGEFGPALHLARGTEDPGARDQLLGRIATAQADIGAREASMSTLLDLQSDVARSRVIDELGGRSLGAGGGAAMADFHTLIELIPSTIAPDTRTRIRRFFLSTAQT